MVKHPRYQAMDDGRQSEIPRAFERHCGNMYQLKRIEPVREKDPKPGPIPRPTFQVLDSDGKLVAHFHPWGNSECHDESFRQIFELMNKDIEQAATRALQEYERH